MDEDAINMSVRRFLKEVGISSQREIEKLLREGGATGPLKLRMELTAEGTPLRHVVEGEVDTGQ